MGFLDALMDVAKKAKCATGFHGGKFEHIPGAPGCSFEKDCPDCFEYITEQRHKYPEINSVDYDSYDSCEKTAVCEYCENQLTRVQHDFVSRGTNGHCEGVEKCSRCGEEKLSGKLFHQWDGYPKKGYGPKGDKFLYRCQICRHEELRDKGL